MTENKQVKIAYLAAVGILFVQLIDVFFLHNHSSVFSTNIIARIVGVILMVILSSLYGLRIVNFCFKSYGWYFEIFYGCIFSVTPVMLIYLFKYVYFYYRGYSNLIITFQPPDIGVTDNSEEFTIAVMIYILTLVLVAVFKEVFYRGFLISQFSGKYGVKKTIIIQALIYTLSFLPTQLYNIISGKVESESLFVSVLFLIGHLFYNFICGIKWGMFYRVNGTVWMSVADNFFTGFLTTSFFYTTSRLPEKWYIFEIIAMQILSFIMFLPFYRYRDKQNELAAAEHALSKEALKMGVDNYNPGMLRKKTGAKSGGEQTDVREYEEPISLSSIKMPTEDDLTLSVRGYEINDGNFNYNTEISSLDGAPSEKSREFFDEMLGKNKESVADGVADTQDNSNAASISDLVKNYFDDSFNKHTFTKKE